MSEGGDGGSGAGEAEGEVPGDDGQSQGQQAPSAPQNDFAPLENPEDDGYYRYSKDGGIDDRSGYDGTNEEVSTFSEEQGPDWSDGVTIDVPSGTFGEEALAEKGWHVLGQDAYHVDDLQSMGLAPADLQGYNTIEQAAAAKHEEIRASVHGQLEAAEAQWSPDHGEDGDSESQADALIRSTFDGLKDASIAELSAYDEANGEGAFEELMQAVMSLPAVETVSAPEGAEAVQVPPGEETDGQEALMAWIRAASMSELEAFSDENGEEAVSTILAEAERQADPEHQREVARHDEANRILAINRREQEAVRRGERSSSGSVWKR